MKTDIDGLHSIIESDEFGDRDYFLLKCHEVAGNVEVLEDKIICCHVKNCSVIGFILPMLKDVFEEHGLEFNVEIARSLPRITTSNGNTIIFTDTSTRGFINIIYFSEEV